MKTNRYVSLLAMMVIAASAAFLPRTAQAEEGALTWGMSNVGETCGGKCGKTNLCCKIVIVGPAPLAEHVGG